MSTINYVGFLRNLADMLEAYENQNMIFRNFLAGLTVRRALGILQGQDMQDVKTDCVDFDRLNALAAVGDLRLLSDGSLLLKAREFTADWYAECARNLPPS